MASSALPSWHPYKNSPPTFGQRADTLSVVSGSLTLAAMGDSITQFARTASGTNDNFENIGYVTTYLAKSLSRVRMPMLNNLGVAGNTTTQMVSRLTDFDAITFDTCFVMGGINDIKASANATTVISNLSAIINYVTQTKGKRCILLTILPNDNWGAFTAPQIATAKAVILEVNSWIMRQHGTRMGRVVSVDTYTNFVSGDIPKTNATYDGLHPSPYGAMIIADDIQTRIATWYGIGSNSIFSTGNLITNPTLSGSGGTLNSGVSNGGGGLGDGWTALRTGGHYTDVNKSSGVQTVYHVRAGTGTTGDGESIYQDITTGFSVGDTVYSIFEVEISGTPTGVDRLAVELTLSGTGVPTKVNALGFDNDAGTSRIAETYMTAGRYFIVTPDLVISSGSSMTLRATLNIGINASLSSDMLLKIHNAGIFKR